MKMMIIITMMVKKKFNDSLALLGLAKLIELIACYWERKEKR